MSKRLRHEEYLVESEPLDDFLEDEPRTKRPCTETHNLSSPASLILTNNSIIPPPCPKITPPPTYEPLLFLELCSILERVCRRSTKREHSLTDRLEPLRVLIIKQQSIGYDMYSLLRLVLCKYDYQRKYEIKEFYIIKIICKCLNLGEDVENVLLGWKKGNKLRKRNIKVIDNLSDFVLGKLGDQGWDLKFTTKPNSITVKEINVYLDKISQANRSVDVQFSIWREFIGRLCAQEIKWVIRIILKDMRIRACKKILESYHDDAWKVFTRSADIKKMTMVCVPGVRADDCCISLFSPVLPMLALFVKDRKLNKLLDTETYVLQTKFDGERILIHYRARDKKIAYFTRNANNFNKNYSDRFDLTVKKALAKVKRNIILDGEMLVYDKRQQKIVEFGFNRTLSTTKNDAYQYLYKCFDVIYLDDKELTNYKFVDRNRILQKYIIPIENGLTLVQSTPVENGMKQVEEALTQACLRNEEGIILKNVNSKYSLHARDEDWIKVKPQDIEDLDLLILAGFKGTKHKTSNDVTSFLMGVRDANTPDFDPKFYTFCKIGNGLNKEGLIHLQEKLRIHEKIFDKNNVPKFINFNVKWDYAKDAKLRYDGSKSYKGGEKYIPDVYYEPKDSSVLQVKAQSVTRTGKYSMCYSLRFPRTVGVRENKDYTTACSTLDIIRTIKDGNRVRKVKKRNERETVIRPPRQRVVSHMNHYDTTKVKLVSDVFQGKEFVMLNISSSSNYSAFLEKAGFKTIPKDPRDQLQIIITMYGGTISQCKSDGSFVGVSNLQDDSRVQSWIGNCENARYADANIVNPEWIFKCTKENAIVPFEFEDLLYCCEETQDYFSSIMDNYGDLYREDLTPHSWDVLCQKLLKDEQQYKMVPRSIGTRNYILIEKKFDMPGYILENITAYIDMYNELENENSKIKNSVLQVADSSILFYKGNVHCCIDEETTHVVVDTDHLERLGSIYQLIKERKLKCKVVDKRWIDECLVDEDMLNHENEFIITENFDPLKNDDTVKNILSITPYINDDDDDDDDEFLFRNNDSMDIRDDGED